MSVVLNRDHNAALNILKKGTGNFRNQTTAGNEPVEIPLAPMNQKEATGLPSGRFISRSQAQVNRFLLIIF